MLDYDPNNQPIGSMTAEERIKMISEVNDINSQMRGSSPEKLRIPLKERMVLMDKRNVVLANYFHNLPIITISRCPICKEPLLYSFDSCGIDGFWWQEKMTEYKSKPKGCEHFQVLTEALNLNNKPPLGGDQEAHIGPPAPYVIPKVLSMPGMTAVIASISMKNGYIAYPIAYFSSQPTHSPALANPWTMTSCNFEVNGKPSFTYITDPWDFDLSVWLDQSKLYWTKPDDENQTLNTDKQDGFPYADIRGDRSQQTIIKDKVFTKPTPNNEKVDPFAE